MLAPGRFYVPHAFTPGLEIAAKGAGEGHRSAVICVLCLFKATPADMPVISALKQGDLWG